MAAPTAAGLQKHIDEFNKGLFNDQPDLDWANYATSKKLGNLQKIVEVHAANRLTLKYDILQKFAESMSANTDLISALKTTLADFQYQGFEPARLAALLFSIHKESGGSMSEFFADIGYCVLLMLMRGPSIMLEKNMSKMSSEGTARVLALKNKYDIKARVADGSVLTVTLSRIAACYPALTCHLMASIENIERPCPAQTLFTKYGITFPPFLRCTTWLSIIPEKSEYLDLIAGIVLYSYEEARVINKITFSSKKGDAVEAKKKEYREKSPSEQMEVVLQYAHAAMLSPIVEQDKRDALVKKTFAVGLSADIFITSLGWSEKFQKHFPTNYSQLKYLVAEESN